MKIFGVILFILIVGGLCALIVFEIVSLVKKIKQIRKDKTKVVEYKEDNRKE